MFNARLIVTVITVCAGGAQVVKGDVLVYYDRAAWESAVASRGLSLSGFPFTPSNLVLCNELATPPTPNTLFGSELTCTSSETQLPFSFQLVTAAPDTSMMLWSPYGVDAIGIDSTTSPFDDGRDGWEVHFNGPPVLAFGFELVDNDFNDGESLVAYGIAGMALGAVTPPVSPPGSEVDDARFVGVIADRSIMRVLMDEALADDDNTGMKNLAFATAKIPAASQWGVVIMFLGTLSAGTIILRSSPSVS